MFFISHRGNTLGPNPEDENKIGYVEETLKNFDVEIDVWYYKNNYYLGHDEPLYKVNNKFLKNKRFWIHCKNLECFYKLSELDVNYFWHEKDKIIITSKGFFWNYPGTILSKKSICVMPEINNTKKINCMGICSDYIQDYYDRYNNI
ncbi:hypothetical protein [Candidatus Pelagibacter sp.]|uniref:hypothetical protein n=1 Tax=Candidatus Pelagibacter sp. TaxID=2024849 RepID=UPI003F85CB84